MPGLAARRACERRAATVTRRRRWAAALSGLSGASIVAVAGQSVVPSELLAIAFAGVAAVVAFAIVERRSIEAEADAADRELVLPQTLGTSVRLTLDAPWPVHAAADAVSVPPARSPAGWHLKQLGKLAVAAGCVAAIFVVGASPMAAGDEAFAAVGGPSVDVYASPPRLAQASAPPRLTPAEEGMFAESRGMNASPANAAVGSQAMAGATAGTGAAASVSAADTPQLRVSLRGDEGRGDRRGVGSGGASEGAAGEVVADGSVVSEAAEPIPASSGDRRVAMTRENTIRLLPRRHRDIAAAFFGGERSR